MTNMFNKKKIEAVRFAFKSFILHTFLRFRIVTVVSKYCIITVKLRKTVNTRKGLLLCSKEKAN